MDSRKSLDLSAILMLVAICFIWAIQQIGLKATADFAAPVLQLGLRSAIAAILLWLVTQLRGQHIVLSGPLAAAGASAGVLFAIEFLLVGESLRHTSASHVVVFLYTAPIFAAIGLHLKLPSERLAPFQWIGIAIASAGIAVAFFGGDSATVSDLSSVLLGDALALAAGAAWGATTILIRTSGLAAIPAAHTLFYQLAVCGALLTATAVITGQADIVPSWQLGANLAFQAIIVSLCSFLVWFWLLTRYVASQMGVFSFMTPLFGVVLGFLLLDEPLTTEFIIGSAGVLAGILIVSAYPWLRQKRISRALSSPAE